MSPELHLLLEWQPRWRGFLDSLGPAMRRSAAPLRGECPANRLTTGGPAVSFCTHALLLALLAAGSPQVTPLSNRVLSVPDKKYAVIYYSAPYLPQMQDAGGAQSGRTGRAGGDAAHHPAQVIRVASEKPPAPVAVAVPQVSLPRSPVAANLIAFSGAAALPIAPPVDPPRALGKLPALPVMVVPPPPPGERSRMPLTPHFDVAVASPAPAIPAHAPRLPRPASPQVLESGYVISTNPGSTVGLPAGSQSASLALSPAANGNPGVGDIGGGLGTAVGTGSGSAEHSGGPGAALAGEGRGGESAAHGGASPGRGPGGTGSGTNYGSIPGVTIRGGMVTLPSFGSADGSHLPPSTAERSQGPPAITVVASPRAGGVLNRYGSLKGAKIYTIYLETPLGQTILEYADRRGATGQFEADLTAPEAITTDAPPGIANVRFVVACVLDRSGLLKDLHVLEPAGLDAGAILSAIQRWRFRPVLRGQQAVEVDAILGFGVGAPK